MRDDAEIETEVELDVGRFFRRVLGKLPYIVVLALLLTVGVYVGLGFVDPRYEAQTSLLIETRETSLTLPTAAAGASTSEILDQQAIASQVQLLRSREIARSIVERFGLADRAEFVPPAGPSLVDRLVHDLGGRIGLDVPEGPKVADVAATDRALESFYEHMSVFAIEGSRVITVTFTSTDRELAADIANAVVQEYLALQSRAKRDSTADAVAWLADQIDELRDTVRDAEAKVQGYRSQNDLFSTGGTTQQTLTQQQLSGLTTELTRQQALKADAEARAAQIDAALKAGTAPNRIELLNSQLVDRLVEQQIGLRAQIAQLSATLLPQHPRMQALQAQVADLDRQITEEARKVLASFEAEASLARAREDEINAQIARLKATSAQAGNAEVELAALEREAAAQRELLDSYLRRYREALGREQSNLLPADARVISTAAPPAEPVFPRRVPMAIAAGAATLLLLVGLVLVRELASGRSLRRVERPAERPKPDTPVAEEAPVPSLAPDVPGETHMSLTTVVEALEEPGRHNVVVTLTEGSDKEGRPLAAVALARALARRDHRVILVDLRDDGANPAAMADQRLGTDRHVGLSDILTREATFADAIYRDRDTRAHFIAAGTKPLRPDDVSGPEIDTVLAALTMTYDRVILDAGDEMIPAIAKRFDVAVVASEHDNADPRTVAAFDRIAAVSDVDILLLLVEVAGAVGQEAEEPA